LGHEKKRGAEAQYEAGGHHLTKIVNAWQRKSRGVSDNIYSYVFKSLK
jgi:hypothetical protein